MADGAQTTTKKHKQFVSEPMGDKLVTELGGIGPKYGERLRAEGFEKVNTDIYMYIFCIRVSDSRYL